MRLITNRSAKPFEKAIELALTLAPAEGKGIEHLHSGLIELCNDARFRLQRISLEGVHRAQGALNTVSALGHEQHEVLWICFHVLGESSANDPLTATSSLLILKQYQELLLHAVDAIGVLGLSLQCSENLSHLVLTREQYEIWHLKEADGPPTQRRLSK